MKMRHLIPAFIVLSVIVMIGAGRNNRDAEMKDIESELGEIAALLYDDRSADVEYTGNASDAEGFRSDLSQFASEGYTYYYDLNRNELRGIRYVNIIDYNQPTITKEKVLEKATELVNQVLSPNNYIVEIDTGDDCAYGITFSLNINDFSIMAARTIFSVTGELIDATFSSKEDFEMPETIALGEEESLAIAKVTSEGYLREKLSDSWESYLLDENQIIVQKQKFKGVPCYAYGMIYYRDGEIIKPYVHLLIDANTGEVLEIASNMN